jgi:hypoxanthine-guanine phosphoribosyltransferase
MLHHALDIKLAVASAVALVAAVTDATTQPQGWEDISLKALLIGALVFVVRLLLKQQTDHKSEIRETWQMHKEEAEKREVKVVSCLEAQTQTLRKLCELTEEQTEHYRSFVKAAVDAKLHQGAGDSVPRR